MTAEDVPHVNPATDRLRRSGRAEDKKLFWRALDEIADTPEFRRWLESEFPAAAPLLDDTSRRGALKMMAASMLLAGLPGCDIYPVEDAVPWVEQPEQAVPGRPQFYATMTPFMGYARPVVAECHAGRPTRLDGNPLHPAATVALDPFAQAEVLALYDPDRSHGALHRGAEITSAEAQATLFRNVAERSGRDGIRLLTGRISSPTLLRQIMALQRRFPEMQWHVFEPAYDGRRDAAVEIAFGRGEVQYHLDKADVVVSLEDDLLGPGPLQLWHAEAWSRRRREGQRSGEPNQLFVAESSPTLTGAKAAERYRIAATDVPAIAAAVAGLLGHSISAGKLPRHAASWARRAAARLEAAAGRSLFTVGPHQPAEIQALALAINHRLGNVGRTLTVHERMFGQPAGGIMSLIEDMEAGSVETLLMFDVDPVFSVPGEPRFAEALQRVQASYHLGLYRDETAAIATWHLPLTHPLETWADARAPDGTAVIGQPTVRPLYGGVDMAYILEQLSGPPVRNAREAVQRTWRQHFEGDFAEAWRRALHDGYVPDTEARQIEVDGVRPLPEFSAERAPLGRIEVSFRPDPSVWDGRYANIPWLQELPKPLSKLTWDNAAIMSPSLAQRLDVRNGQIVEIATPEHAIAIPAWILPGQTDDSVTLHFGQGRHAIGAVASGAGTNVNPLRRSEEPWLLPDVEIRPQDRFRPLADTQMHGTMGGQDLVRTVSASMAAQPEREDLPEPAHESIYGTQFAYQKKDGDNAAWAMSIDLDTCIGCNACVTACVAENNLLMVGRDQVRMGREMHWIRVDRYFEGDSQNPLIHFQPVPCMHCENAPCELGCPVRATVHGPEGLNQMIYNRCIGTRTCSSYCPYKVRRFNWYDYSQPRSPAIAAVRNPDVTVRARGVMEKCTYCVQRIARARRDAKKENRDIRDGEVQTACQTACPTRAIVFGNQRDRTSAVNRAKRSPRDYVLLEDLNVRPRTSYLARIRDGEQDV